MRAMLLRATGGPENFELADIPVPPLRPGHVLVRVHAAGLNPVDARIRSGLPIGPALPAVLGADVAGTVEKVGADVAGIQAGDEVYGCVGGVRGMGGTFAEHVIADARLLAKKPGSLSMREAAALPLVSITAANCMSRAGVVAGDHVLVHGGCGGVGHVAVQLAKARGARVSASVSTERKALLARSLGADDVVLYREEGVADYVSRLTGGRGFDVVIDTVGGANLDLSFQAAATYGRVVATAARSTHDLSPLHAKALSLHVVFMLVPLLADHGREAHGQVLREVAVLADAGGLRPLVDPARFELAQLGDAFRHLESGHALGKVVIELGDG